MEHYFQSDVNGVLEYAPVTSPSCDFVVVLRKSINKTLEYFERSAEALDALQAVLFRAWRYKEGHNVNFSISRYERGIQTEEFIQLMDSNNLFERTMSRLYELPVEEAIDVLQELIHADPSPRYLTYFLRVANVISDKPSYSQTIDFIFKQSFKVVDENDAAEILAVIREQQSHATLTQSVKLTELANWLRSQSQHTATAIPSESNPRKKRIIIKTFDDISSTDSALDLRKKWMLERNEPRTDTHIQAFILICQHLRKHAQPVRSLEFKEVQLRDGEDQDEEASLKKALAQMLQYTSSDNSSVASCKRWCLSVLLEQRSGTKSVLTAMVQFSDLWITQWIQPYALDAITSLIIKENIIVHYYHHLYKVLFCMSQEARAENTITDLCSFFYQLLMKITEKTKFLIFRDYVYRHISSQHSAEYNLFDIEHPPMDLDAELTKAINQCNSETVKWDSTLQKLGALTVICPKAVILEMVSQCCSNKDRHATTIPVLRALGSLCRTRIQQKGKAPTTILIYCLELRMSEWTSEMIEENTANIAAFIAACSRGVDVYAEYPPLLVPRRHVDEHTDVLLDLQYFVPDKIMAWLDIEQQGNNVFCQLGLKTLDMLCSSPSIQWNDWSAGLSKLESSDVPVGCIDPLLLARTISGILDLKNNKNFSLHELEAALAFQKKLASVLNVLYSNRLSKELNVFFEELKTKHDWRTCMTWCDLQYNVSFKQNSSTPAKLNIPIQLEPIINDLGGTCQLYRPKNYDDPETWPTMFEACKLSSTFTKQLFAAKDYWMYSLMLLWNHPDDDTLVTEKLQQTLHPSISPSVMNEYEQLLVNFLGELYDSCDTAGEVVREYSYSHKGIQTLVELLNDSDAKTYWIVLYMCKLLETEAPPNAYAEDHLTYTVGIIKAFNVCHNWTHPFQDQGSQLASLRRFRDAAFDDDIMHQNVAKSWDADGQETDELSNAKVIDVSYPFMDANSQSTQALSILTLCRLCNVFNQVKSDAIREIVRVPLLQVVEGLKGSEQRQKFQQLASSQVKSRLDSWRKGKKQKRRVILRPVIDPKHTDVVTYYTGLLEDPGLQSAISQTFKLVDGEQHQLPSKNVNKKYQAIYCI